MSNAPLSARLRPDVECAPWVIDEVKVLETKLAGFEAQEHEAVAAAVVLTACERILGRTSNLYRMILDEVRHG